MFKRVFLSLILSLTLLINLSFSSPDWKLVTETEEVRVESKYEDYHDETNGVHHRYLVLRFVNKTSNDITVTYDIGLWYNGNKLVSDEGDSNFIIIDANGHVNGFVGGDSKLAIFSEHINIKGKGMTKLTNIEITNIETEEIE